jgi:hypothetical protein
MKTLKAFLNEEEEQKDFVLKKDKAHFSSPTWRNKGAKPKVTAYDYVVHHPETDEPLFHAKKDDYGKTYRLEWHPYMKALHPELEHSFEHGSNAPKSRTVSWNGKSERRATDWVENTKDSLPYAAKRIYDSAARGGFKDTLKVTAHDKEVSYQHRNWDTGQEETKTATTKVHSFHDPETGERILHHDEHNGSRYSGDYLRAHNIHANIAQSQMESGRTGAYHHALKIYNEKGKSYGAVGKHVMKAKAKVYTAGTVEGMVDHGRVSQAHEDHIRKTYGDRPGFNLVRHTRTLFTATANGKYDGYTPVHVVSVMHPDGTLMSHEAGDEYHGAPEKLDHKF